MRAFLTIMTLAVFLVLPATASAAPSVALDWTPAIPDHLENPGGQFTATCVVDTDGTVPENLIVRVLDPNGLEVVYLEFPGFTEYTLEWVVPDGMMDGVYKYVVDYVAQSGEVVSADGSVLVAGGVTGICMIKFNDLNGDGIFDSDEPFLEGWEMCYDGPSGQACEFTDENGLACWFGVDPGVYNLCETLQDGFECTNCEDCCCVTLEVQADEIGKVLIGNQETVVPTIESSWGQIKAVHR